MKIYASCICKTRSKTPRAKADVYDFEWTLSNFKTKPAVKTKLGWQLSDYETKHRDENFLNKTSWWKLIGGTTEVSLQMPSAT